MVGEIFTTIGEVLTSYVQSISSVFQNIINIFYNSESGLTLLGTLVLIGVGIGIVVWAFNLVRGLMSL